MATIRQEDYPIKDNGFEYLGNYYNCQTVYICDNCPHAGNLMCCHNCPNF